MGAPARIRQRLRRAVQARLQVLLSTRSAMKNASSAYRGAPMPGGRSYTQFRAARIRRVSFQWKQLGQPQTPAEIRAETRASHGPGKDGGSFSPS